MLVQYDCGDRIESLKKGRIRAQIKSECAVNLKEMEYVEEYSNRGCSSKRHKTAPYKHAVTLIPQFCINAYAVYKVEAL